MMAQKLYCRKEEGSGVVVLPEELFDAEENAQNEQTTANVAMVTEADDNATPWVMQPRDNGHQQFKNHADLGKEYDPADDTKCPLVHMSDIVGDTADTRMSTV